MAAEEEHHLVAFFDAAQEAVELVVQRIARGIEHLRHVEARGFELARQGLRVVARVAQFGDVAVIVVAHHQGQAGSLRLEGQQRGGYRRDQDDAGGQAAHGSGALLISTRRCALAVGSCADSSRLLPKP